MNLIELDRELTALGASTADGCMTVVADDVHVNVMPDEEGTFLYMYCFLRRLPPFASTGTLRALMHVNDMGVMTDGGHLGLVDEDDSLMYSRRYRIDGLAVGSLAKELKGMVASVHRLREKTDDICRDASLGDAVPAAASPASEGYDALSVTEQIPFGWLRI